MSNVFFKFKQFTVFQDLSAMKVGTDGVLLGAWTNVDKCNKALDIGTGSGLLALMIAQRNAKIMIDAIDIDKGSIMQARQNIIHSPFYHCIEVHHKSFQDLIEQADKRYDLIISNPPYFQNALKSPNLSRSNARHDDTLSFYEILSKGMAFLTDNGRVALILPHEFKEAVLLHATTEGFYVHRILNVFSVAHKPPKRLLIELGRSEVKCVEEDLIIERGRHQYTDDFKLLTKDFYL